MELIQQYHKGNKTLELIRVCRRELDEDDELYNEYWMCKISDGRQIKFDSVDVALMFITENCWLQTFC